MAKTYNVGVIGYGKAAKVFHIPLIAVTSSLKLHTVVQRTPTASDSAAKDHPGVKVVSSADALFSDPDVDIVVVTSTPETHFAFTKGALEAGKHVLVEKPFVPTAAEAQQLLDLSQRSKRLLCVYQNRRWDTDFLTFRKLQRDATLGRIVEFETHFDRYRADRPDTWTGQLGMDRAGGVVYDLGAHLIDQVVVAFGMPREVTGTFANQRGDAGEPDSLTALLKYDGENDSGLLATVKAAVISPETSQLRYWVRGTKGSFKKHHLDVQEDQLKAGLKPGDKDYGVERDSMSGQLVVMEGDTPKESIVKNVEPETYAALYQQFVQAIDQGDPEIVPVKASEARDVLTIIEAIRESARTKRTIAL
ncbi:MAG: hypothetical protein M1821_008983 [Bathelium mastoideum]|nr:MAG: hypothetical protein M1821_008983 [Bathelium mastoideum]